jgi:hypothetical protein
LPYTNRVLFLAAKIISVSPKEKRKERRKRKKGKN